MGHVFANKIVILKKQPEVPKQTVGLADYHPKPGKTVAIKRKAKETKPNTDHVLVDEDNHLMTVKYSRYMKDMLTNDA